MTLSKSDLIDVLASTKAGGDFDLIRREAELFYQTLIEAETSEQIWPVASNAVTSASRR
jgi:hypothetical protein